MGLLLTKVLLNIIFLLAFYFIGNLILIFLKTEKTSRLSNFFFALFTGILAVSVAWALWTTKFQTLYLALIPLLIWGYSIKPKVHLILKWNDVIKWLPAFVIVSFIMMTGTELFIFYNYMGISESFPTLPDIHSDYVFYANVAAHLNQTGHENFHINSEIPSINVYHYTEMWLSAFINAITAGPYMNSVLFHTFPLLFTIAWIGFAALGETLVQGKKIVYYIAAGATCYIIAPLTPIVELFSSVLKGDVHSLLFSHYYKLSVIYIFILAIFLVRNNIHAMIFFSMLLMIFYQTILPAISGFLFLYFLYFILKNKKFAQPYATGITAIVFAFAIVGILVITHKFKGVEITGYDFYKIYIGDASFYIKTWINIIGSTFLKTIISCFPYIIIGILVFKQIQPAFRLSMAGFFLIQLSGLFVWALFLQMPDSVQFWSNIYCPAVNVIIFAVLLIAFNDRRVWVKIFSVIMIAVNVYVNNPFEKIYRAETPGEIAVIKAVKKHPDAHFAFLRHEDEFSNIFMKNTNFAIPADYLSFYVNSYSPVCINSTKIPLETYWEQLFFNNTPFARYSKNKDLPIEKLQSDFIKEHNIKFIVATEKAEIPPFLYTMTDSTIIDSENEIKLLVLKTE